MWFESIIKTGVNKVVDSVANGLDKLFTSDEERLKVQAILEKIRAELISELMQSFIKITKLKADIIIAETKGESWLQRNWRPITMMLFAYIIANEYIVAPYVEVLFGVELDAKPISERMYDLLALGLGGYISALGIKKVVESTKWSK